MLNKKEYENTVIALNEARDAYYNCGNGSNLTDEEYDNLLKLVISYEAAHPDKIPEFSPVGKVGFKATGKTRKLTRPMLSLENCFPDAAEVNTHKELKEWLSNFHSDTVFILEEKYDGLAVEIVYNNGVLESATTRGDGLEGEDVTANARVAQNVPESIPDKSQVVVRGEMIITHKDFETICKTGMYSNPRNAAAGALRLKDPVESAKRLLTFKPYDVDFDDDDSETLSDKFFRIADELHIVAPGIRLVTKDEIHRDYELMELNRDTGKIQYDIDGMVIKVNDLKVQAKMGNRTSTPRWAIAYKFKPKAAISKILNVNFYVGRTGVITPVARITPTIVGGVQVDNISLANMGKIKEKDIRIFDTVEIVRSGDVIPYITKVFTELRYEGSTSPVVAENVCPSCGSDLTETDNRSVCTLAHENAFGNFGNGVCEEAAIQRLVYFASRECMRIEGLGEETVRKLYAYLKDKKVSIEKVTGLYNADVTMLTYALYPDSKLRDMVSIRNLREELKKSFRQPLSTFLHSLGIPLVGKRVSKIVAELAYKRDPDNPISALLNLGPIDFEGISGVGDKIKEAFAKGISYYQAEGLFDEMVKLGFDPVVPEIKETVQTKYSGMNIVLTGSFDAPRESYKEAFELMGCKVSGNVSNKTNLVVYGENAGSKLAKANKLNIDTAYYKDIDITIKQ